MAYTKRTYRLRRENEICFTWLGNYGAKGERRKRKTKPTPEQIAKQNQWNRIHKMRRVLAANFDPGDYWVTLKYAKNYHPPSEQVEKDIRNFLRRLRGKYRSRDKPLYWVYRMEIGKHGGVHIHLVVNDIGQSDKLVAEEWAKVPKSAGIYFTHIFKEGSMEDLAAYICKKPKEEEFEQLSFYQDACKKEFIKFSSSRNLVRPEAEAEEKYYSHWTMRKILENELKPTDGYYIDKNSVYRGVNPVTGHSYLRYIEKKIERERGEPPWT